MGSLVCNHCRAELTIDNIKDITFDRTYEMIDGEEIETEIAYVECSKCGNITVTDSVTGDLLRFNLVNMRSMSLHSNRDILHNFNDIRGLLEHLSDTDIEKVKGRKFKVFEQSPDDDSGDVYYYITIFKGDTEIGNIDMQYHYNTYFDLIGMEIKTTDDTPYYTYEMTLYEDSKEAFSNKDTGDHFNNSKGGFSIQDIWNPFDDSKFRCKKCGKVFCNCNRRV